MQKLFLPSMPHLVKALVAAFAVVLLSILGACGGGGGSATSPSQPDTTAPTVSATAAVGTEAVVLSAAVSDNVAVTQVEFLVDGGATKATVTDSQGRSAYSTSLPIGGFGTGSHSVVARARDAAGNTTDAAPVTFSVGQGTVPSSAIKVIASSTKDGGNVTFTVDIQSDKQITLTNFFIDGEFVGGRADDQRHYSFSRTLSSGTHRLVVDVTDANGNNAQTQVIVVL